MQLLEEKEIEEDMAEKKSKETDENVQTTFLRDEWGYMDVEFRDYYQQTKVTGPDTERFLDRFFRVMNEAEEGFMIDYPDDNEVSLKLWPQDDFE